MFLAALVSAIAVFVSSVVWEHIARTWDSTFKPSVGLWNLVEPTRNFFSWLGGWIARLSSFYTYLKNFFGELFVTIGELLTPLGELAVAPLYFFKGYLDTAITYNYYILVFLGTATILFIIYCVASYYLTTYGYISPNYYILPYPRIHS